jgi:hypothetical protein
MSDITPSVEIIPRDEKRKEEEAKEDGESRKLVEEGKGETKDAEKPEKGSENGAEEDPCKDADSNEEEEVSEAGGSSDEGLCTQQISTEELNALRAAKTTLTNTILDSAEAETSPFGKACKGFTAFNLESSLNAQDTLGLLLSIKTLLDCCEKEVAKEGPELEGFKQDARAVISDFSPISKRLKSLIGYWSQHTQSLRSSDAGETIWAKFLSTFPAVGKALKDKIKPKELQEVKGTALPFHNNSISQHFC